MGDEKDSLHKSSSLERRLRLRKGYKESIDEKIRSSDESSTENKKSNTASSISQSGYDDDSILDFKSPKKVNSLQPRIIDSYKPPHKSKRKPSHSKPKLNKEKKADSSKLSQSKKIARDTQQPLIESSFFKSDKKEADSSQSSADVKIAHVCPLCFKTFKDDNSQAVHMKSCATKNNVSTKQLMVAVELQERQAAERKSLGLLSAPVLQEKKKPVPRKMTPHNDPDLQLALALSKSLYEKEEMENWDEAQIVAISSSPSSLPDSNTDCCQKTTLQSFGFTSSRNMSPVKSWPTKIKRKKLTEPTILQRRTAVERECILTDRIAEILMSCQDFTQRSHQQEDRVNHVKEKIVIKSQLLQQIYQTEDTLWDKAKLTPTKNVFYVKELSSQITPLEKKEQIVNEEQNIRELMFDSTVNDKRTLLDKQEVEMQTVPTTDNGELTGPSSAVRTCCREKEFLDGLASSWRNMLNDSSASDVIVFVRDGKHIWTHKLVFYARCANILLDVTANDTEFSTAPEKLRWTDVDCDVALAFLEFVYCGVIDRHSRTLDSDTSLSGIRSLARKYKVNDLFVYLRRRESTCRAAEVKRERDDELGNTQCSRETLLRENSDADLPSVEDTEDSCLLQDDQVVSTKSPEGDNSRSNAPSHLERGASPDMFDDTCDATRHDDKSATYAKDHEDSNLRVLLSLIKQDADVDIYSQRLLCDTRNTKGSDPDAFSRVKNADQDVIELDSDSRESAHEDTRENPGAPRGGESKSAPDAARQKGDVTLFIEKVRRENARSDSDLDVEHSVFSPLRHKNPFLADVYNSENAQFCNANAEQSPDRKKPGRLSELEQRMRSYAEKNPQFYTRLTNEITRRVAVPLETGVSPERTIDNATSSRVSASPAKDADASWETSAATPAVRSSQPGTTDRSFDATVCDSEGDDEEDISMYSRYTRDHKDNSIAKYRAAIVRSASASDLSRGSASSDVTGKAGDEAASHEARTQAAPPDHTDVIVSSDTEIESVSSGVGCPVVLRSDDREDPASRSLYGRTIESSGRSLMSERKNSYSPGSEQISKVTTTELEREVEINDAIKSSKDALNGDTESVSDDADLGAIFTQSLSRHLSRRDDNRTAESVPSPIMVPSSPDASNIESLLSDTEHCGQDVPGAESPTSRKSVEFSLNFEDEIYLANVDVNRYEKHALEKSRSAGVLNVTRSTKGSARGCDHRDGVSNNATTDTDGSSNNAAVSATQKFASVRNLRKKSLSEGHISMTRLCGQGAAEHVSVRVRYSSQDIAKPASKITEKDVTPPPDYNGMGTPELHREMKKYGLKAQKRGRAVKLLTHIYNELHPLVPARQEVTEISSGEDDGPPAKKRNVNDNDSGNSNEDASDDELLCSQESNGSVNSVKAAINKEMEFYETESVSPLRNLSDISEAFAKLIDGDRDLHNKILRYEPVNIENLHCTLRARGFKCKLPDLMSFLDEQCITFYAPEQNVKTRTRKR